MPMGGAESSVLLAVVSHCGGDPYKYTFPDGEDGDALASTVLATLACVLSKVLSWRQGWGAYCDLVCVSEWALAEWWAGGPLRPWRHVLTSMKSRG